MNSTLEQLQQVDQQRLYGQYCLENAKLFFSKPGIRRFSNVLWAEIKDTDYLFFGLRHIKPVEILKISPQYAKFIFYLSALSAIESVGLKYSMNSESGIEGKYSGTKEEFLTAGTRSFAQWVSISVESIHCFSVLVLDSHIEKNPQAYIDAVGRKMMVARFLGEHWKLKERYFNQLLRMLKDRSPQEVDSWAAKRKTEWPTSYGQVGKRHFRTELYAEFESRGLFNLIHIAQQNEFQERLDRLSATPLQSFLRCGVLDEADIEQVISRWTQLENQVIRDELKASGCWPPPAEPTNLELLSEQLRLRYHDLATPVLEREQQAREVLERERRAEEASEKTRREQEKRQQEESERREQDERIFREIHARREQAEREERIRRGQAAQNSWDAERQAIANHRQREDEAKQRPDYKPATFDYEKRLLDD